MSEYKIDPVCGMQVNTDPSAGKKRTTYKDETYYFCNPKCHDKFVAAPDEYLNPVEKTPSEDELQAWYTCPMDPEVRQIGPGACPKCGMALEPESPLAGDEDTSEYDDMRRRFGWSAVFTVPVFLIAMGEMIPGNPIADLVAPNTNQWLQLVLSSIPILWGGKPFFQRFWNSIKTMNLNMFTLIGLGTGVAYSYSVVAVVAPSLFPGEFRDSHGLVAVYFEAGAVIVTLVLLGQLLELKARGQTSSAIRALLDLAPKRARRISADGTETEIELQEVVIGDILRIRPGETVPIDGTVVDGNSHVDESMITGEPVPVEKSNGNSLIGGTINGTGSFTMEATAVGNDTKLSQIVAMVTQAQRSKAQLQKLADTVSNWFVPTVVLTSIMTFVIWAIWGPSPSLTYGLVNAVAVLIIACPCALGLATPMSIMVATGKAASHGVLFKNAEALEIMHDVTTVVVDKTGTLTEGRPSVTNVVSHTDASTNEVLAIAAAVDSHSEHPLATAIVNSANEQNIENYTCTDFKSITGQGATGCIDNQSVFVGNSKLMESNNIPLDELASNVRNMRDQGHTAIYVARGSRLLGVISVADPIKATTPNAIRQLQDLGLNVVMLTGDNEITAKAVAKDLNLDNVIADVLPEQKAQVIKELQQNGEIVAMAGDGINDAPALAQADVGIAMGTGTDVAMESAMITLVKGNLDGIVRAHQISVATVRNIKQNLLFALGYNSLGIPIAAGVLYPFLGVLLSPMVGAAAMSLSSVSVIGNALRLRSLRLS